MSVAADVLLGDYDDELDVILEAVKERRKMIRQNKVQALATIRPGDIVILKRIKYEHIMGTRPLTVLRGTRAKITDKKETRLEGYLLEKRGIFHRNQPVSIPASCVIKEEDLQSHILCSRPYLKNP